KVVLYSLDRVPFMRQNYEQNCLIVNRFARFLGPNASGSYAVTRDWIRDHGGKTPLPIVDGTITRISVGDYLAVRYAFNPDAYGCNPADPDKQGLVDAVTEVGEQLQVLVDQGFRKHQVGAVSQSTLQDCGAGLPREAMAPSPRRERRSTIADRLKQLDGLRDQGLVTPAEYEERRKKILDAL